MNISSYTSENGLSPFSEVYCIYYTDSLCFWLEILNKKLKAFSSTMTHNCVAAKDTNTIFGEK